MRQRNRSLSLSLLAALAALVVGGGALLVTGCGPDGPPTVPEVVIVPEASLPTDPDAPIWQKAPVHAAALILQDMVEPRLLTPSTAEVQVQAVSDGTRVAFRLSWADPGKDDLPGPAHFTDACAVQLPVTIAANVPAPQMGEVGGPVEITYWRSAWQAMVDGRGDTIKDLYPGAAVDHYPFEAHDLKPGSDEQKAMASRYAPARALGNHMAGPRDKPVEDLIAQGPGSLSPGPPTGSDGRGRWAEKTGWAVVISRRLPAGLSPGARSQVAFAVWQGANQEVGARKMRTGWIPLLLEKKP